MINVLEKNYEQFSDVVGSIIADDTDAEYIGSGIESRVWRTTIDGNDYAVKIAQKLSPRGRPRDREGATRRSAENGIRALGIKGLEQIRAVSVENAAVVYDFAQGLSLDKIPLKDMMSIPDEQLEALAKTVRQATAIGIEFDGWNTSGANAIYSQESGFTLIDYWDAKRDISEKDNMKFALRSLGQVGVYYAERMGFAKGEFKLQRVTWD